LTILERQLQIGYVFIAFLKGSEARSRKYFSSRYKHHFITGLLQALQLIHSNGRTGLRVREGRKKSTSRYMLLKIGEKINPV